MASFSQRYMPALVVAAILASRGLLQAPEPMTVPALSALPDRDDSTEDWDAWATHVLAVCEVDWHGWSSEQAGKSSLSASQRTCLLDVLKVHGESEGARHLQAREVVATRLLQGADPPE